MPIREFSCRLSRQVKRFVPIVALFTNCPALCLLVIKDYSVPPAVLVVAPGWVGDIVMMQPMLASIVKQNQDVKIDVLVAPQMAGLISRMPEVHESVTMPLGHGKLGLISRYRLGKHLVGRYGWALVLPNSFKSALVPWFAAIPRRTGFLGEMRWGLLNDVCPLNPALLPRMVDRFMFLVQRSGLKDSEVSVYPRLMVSQDQKSAIRNRFNLSQACVALCIGAEYGPAKRWPATHYAQLAWLLAERGYEVLLVGSPKDQGIASDILVQSPFCKDLTGKTTLEQAIDVLSVCNLVVCNDSGLMHVAAALDRPLIAIYGSSSAGFTPPLSSQARILSLNLECSPCFKRICPLGHLNCLNGISAARVNDEVDSFLH
ncbi:MAG: lipopolysaccharide heptosyltransferase II [Proteobacteria bacterium]|nr:lipopolysaccharide heptosyltransferase II [Pseudomonadota bacterium]